MLKFTKILAVAAIAAACCCAATSCQSHKTCEAPAPASTGHSK